MLEIDNLSVRYGPITAVRNLSLSVKAGEAVALLGPNGAGKSSTLLAVMGLASGVGRITFDGRDLTGLPTEDRVRLGIALVPEGRRVFANLTVAENLTLGGALLSGRVARDAAADQVFTLFPKLAERRAQMAGTLSGGEQQMLAIGRALMAGPRLLILDEPSLGLAPLIVAQIFDRIATLKASGLTLMIVEQNATQALRVADRAFVLANGQIALMGDAADLLATGNLAAAYLGA
jgi:branched-chain amino acid transport system ATP-binding protein